MNTEEIETRLTKYLDKTEELVNKGIDFGNEQIPEFIHELLNWIFWDNVIHSSLLLFVLAVLFFVTRLSHKYKEPDTFDPMPRTLVIGVSWVVFTIVSMFVFKEIVVTAKKAIKVCAAPRLVIVDEIKNLTK